MSIRLFEFGKLALNAFALIALSLWFGGFTFYSGFVLWILHDRLGSLDAGFITQEVSTDLNWIGASAVILCWLMFAADPALRRGWLGRGRILLLTATTILLAILFPLHRVLDDRLERHGLSGFYRIHRYYLIVATAQWGINAALLALSFGNRVSVPKRQGATLDETTRQRVGQR